MFLSGLFGPVSVEFKFKRFLTYVKKHDATLISWICSVTQVEGATLRLKMLVKLVKNCILFMKNKNN